MDRFVFNNTSYGDQPRPLSNRPREGWTVVGAIKVHPHDQARDIYGPEALTASAAQCAALLQRAGQEVGRRPKGTWARVDRQMTIGITEDGEVYVARTLNAEKVAEWRGTSRWVVAAADATLLDEVDDPRIDAWRSAWANWPAESLPAWLGEPWLGGDDAADWRPPTPEALRGLLAVRGVTQAKASTLVGANARTMRKWCAGEPMPFATWFTLRALVLR